jgi:hypothetical protein
MALRRGGESLSRFFTATELENRQHLSMSESFLSLRNLCVLCVSAMNKRLNAITAETQG